MRYKISYSGNSIFLRLNYSIDKRIIAKPLVFVLPFPFNDRPVGTLIHKLFLYYLIRDEI